MLKLGVDIGGTFTDFVLLDTVTGKRYLDKVLTTPRNPAEGFMTGVKSVLKSAGVDAGALQHVIHGTTLVVNAIIERKGCRTGLLTTEGFEDILEMRRGKRFDMDDLLIEAPPSLVPRAMVRGALERVNKNGVAIVPFDEAVTRKAVESLVAEGVESIAVSFLHSYRNSEHEVLAARLIKQIAPGVTVSISSEVAPDVREYERTLTTVANAYTQPIVEKYISEVTDNLEKLGYSHGLYLIQSDAGLTTGRIAAKYPVRLMESGPAGGSVAARYFSHRLKRPDIVAFDMGGTTAKVSFISNGEIVTAPELEVARHHRFKRGSGLPIRVPVVQMMEIGAGGGGIARVDEVGLLRVGPESAGADPGPACYGRGGKQATVTDANLLLGYLNADYFLGGRRALSKNTASAAMDELAKSLNLEWLRAAWGIHEIVTEDMAQAARMHLMERGADPRAYAMLAFGGAGPLHACRLARKVGMKEVIIPHSAGVASAFGFLVAPISITLLRAYPKELARVDLGHLGKLFEELEARGLDFLKQAGVSEAEMTLTRFGSLRYAGQGSELMVPLPKTALDRAGMKLLEESFHEQFAKVYGRSNRKIEVEALNWVVVASGSTPAFETHSPVSGAMSLERGSRKAYFPEVGGFVDCPVFLREMMKPGFSADGPALIEERESTTVILPDSKFSVDEDQNLCISL